MKTTTVATLLLSLVMLGCFLAGGAQSLTVAAPTNATANATTKATTVAGNQGSQAPTKSTTHLPGSNAPAATTLQPAGTTKASNGGSCNSSDASSIAACSSGFCDPLVSQCRIKAGVSCSSSKECVIGAVCDGTPNQCNCAGKYKSSSTVAGTCEAGLGEVGGSCNATVTCVDNAECKTGTSSFCVCKTGFTVNAAKATCEEKSGAVKAAMSIMWVAILTFLSTLL